MNSRRLSSRCSAAVAVTFFFTHCLFASAAETAFWKQRVPPSFPSPMHSEVPPRFPADLSPEFGFTRSIAVPPGFDGRRVVIHVHDVHRNPEVQKNVSRFLCEMLERRGGGLVGLEGAFGPIDAALFRSYPHAESVRAAAEALLRDNLLSGGIHAALTVKEGTASFVGVDDPRAYRANVEAYRSAAPFLNGNRRALAELTRDLEERKNLLFGPSLLTFDRAAAAFREKRLSLVDYAAVVSEALPESLSSDRPLHVFLRAVRLESSLRLDRVEAERNQLLSALTGRLKPDRSAALLRAAVAFRTGSIPQSVFLRVLEDDCRAAGLSLKCYPVFSRYLAYAALVQTLGGDALFRDLRSAEHAVYDRLARTLEERKLVACAQRVALLEKLVGFTLTPDDWEAFKRTRWGEERRELQGLVFFERFFREAEARNDAMAAGLLRAMNRRGVSTALLVSGGFHGAGIERRLSDAGVAVVSFVPAVTRIETTDGTRYLSEFERRSPLDRLFPSDRLTVPPEAFAGPVKSLLVADTVGQEGQHGRARESARYFAPLVLKAGAVVLGVLAWGGYVWILVASSWREIGTIGLHLGSASIQRFAWTWEPWLRLAGKAGSTLATVSLWEAGLSFDAGARGASVVLPLTHDPLLLAGAAVILAGLLITLGGTFLFGRAWTKRFRRGYLLKPTIELKGDDILFEDQMPDADPTNRDSRFDGFIFQNSLPFLEEEIKADRFLDILLQGADAATRSGSDTEKNPVALLLWSRVHERYGITIEDLQKQLAESGPGSRGEFQVLSNDQIVSTLNEILGEPEESPAVAEKRAKKSEKDGPAVAEKEDGKLTEQRFDPNTFFRYASRKVESKLGEEGRRLFVRAEKAAEAGKRIEFQATRALNRLLLFQCFPQAFNHEDNHARARGFRLIKEMGGQIPYSLGLRGEEVNSGGDLDEFEVLVPSHSRRLEDRRYMVPIASDLKVEFLIKLAYKGESNGASINNGGSPRYDLDRLVERGSRQNYESRSFKSPAKRNPETGYFSWEDAPAVIFINLFGLKGYEIQVTSPLLAQAGGMESSNAYLAGLFIGASMLAGARYTEADAWLMAKEFENQLFGGKTGGQGTLASFEAGKLHYFMTDEHGRDLVFKAEDGLSATDLNRLGEHVMLAHPGPPPVDMPDIERMGKVVLDSWTAPANDGDPIILALEREWAVLGKKEWRALKRHRWKEVGRLRARFGEVRDLVSKRWLRLVLLAKAGEKIDPDTGQALPPYAFRYLERVEHDPAYGSVRTLLADPRMKGRLTNLSLYSYGVEELIRKGRSMARVRPPWQDGGRFWAWVGRRLCDVRNFYARVTRDPGVVVTPTGAGGNGATLKFYAWRGPQQLQDFIRELNREVQEKNEAIVLRWIDAIQADQSDKLMLAADRFRAIQSKSRGSASSLAQAIGARNGTAVRRLENALSSNGPVAASPSGRDLETVPGANDLVALHDRWEVVTEDELKSRGTPRPVKGYTTFTAARQDKSWPSVLEKAKSKPVPRPPRPILYDDWIHRFIEPSEKPMKARTIAASVASVLRESAFARPSAKNGKEVSSASGRGGMWLAFLPLYRGLERRFSKTPRAARWLARVAAPSLLESGAIVTGTVFVVAGLVGVPIAASDALFRLFAATQLGWHLAHGRSAFSRDRIAISVGTAAGLAALAVLDAMGVVLSGPAFAALSVLSFVLPHAARNAPLAAAPERALVRDLNRARSADGSLEVQEFVRVVTRWLLRTQEVESLFSAPALGPEPISPGALEALLGSVGTALRHEGRLLTREETAVLVADIVHRRPPFLDPFEPSSRALRATLVPVGPTPVLRGPRSALPTQA